MRILIISGSFYPRNSPRSFRTTELAKEFARQGHEVKVVIPDTQYDYAELEKCYTSLQICQSKEITWKDFNMNGRGLMYWSRRILRRILIQFLEYPTIQWYLKMPKILRKESGYDLMVSIAYPHPIHWGIARCIKKGMNLSKTWVADCGDPYMGCKTSSFKPAFYFAYFEKLFCKLADFITVPFEAAKEGYYDEFQHKIKAIPQAFNFDDIKITDRYEPNEIITFIYAGSFIPGERDPRPVLKYLSSIDMDFCFVVYTKQTDLFEKYIPILGNKLVINDLLPRIELLYEMSKADFLLNLEYGTNIQRASKLIEYSLVRRPILSLYSQDFDTEKLAKFLHRDYSQQYYVSNIEDYNINNAVKKFIEFTHIKYD